MDPYYAFWYNVVEVNDGDVVALDLMVVVVNLLMNVMDHHDVTSSLHLDPLNDVEASFYTYVDVVEVDYQDDVDWNVEALNPADLTYDDVDSYSKRRKR
jgi:hypothetical protein